jgi:hypothetical protein
MVLLNQMITELTTTFAPTLDSLPPPLPITTFKVGIAVKLVAQPFCMLWHEGCSRNAL